MAFSLALALFVSKKAMIGEGVRYFQWPKAEKLSKILVEFMMNNS
tara:strand:+ start:106 stop:240 length:135 start_codon:yes stop_codon:yes gene_type:complete